MTSPDPVVERVARAIFTAAIGGGQFQRLRVELQDSYRVQARAAVAAMGDANPEPDSDRRGDVQAIFEMHHIMDGAIVRGGYRPGEDEHVGRILNRFSAISSVPVPVAPQTQHGDEAAARDAAVAALYGWAEDCSGCKMPALVAEVERLRDDNEALRQKIDTLCDEDTLCVSLAGAWAERDALQARIQRLPSDLAVVERVARALAAAESGVECDWSELDDYSQGYWTDLARAAAAALAAPTKETDQ